MSNGECAWRHLQILVDEIGPRPAGSLAEERARQYVAGQLSRWGYSVERQPVVYAPRPGLFPLYALAGLALAAGGCGLAVFPYLGMVLPILFLSLPEVARQAVRSRPCTQYSENLLAWLAPRAVGPGSGAETLILSAHLDTAPALALRHPFLVYLYGRSMDLAQRVALAICALAVLNWSGLPVPSGLNGLASLAGILAGSWLIYADLYNQSARRDEYAPGAIDNASGVSVVLALAERLAERPPCNLRVGFLFTGAEETGLHGARAFVKNLDTSAGPVSILCLDMVGAGSELRFATQDGTLFPRQADARLNTLVQQAHPGARGLAYTLKSGDFAVFLEAGLPATNLEVSGSSHGERAYHTIQDKLDVVQQSALEMAAQAAGKVVDLLDDSGLVENSFKTARL